MKPFRIVHDHSAGCIFRDPTVEPKECWYLDPREPREYKNHRSFLYAVCMDPDCRGRLRISEAALEDFIYTQTGGPTTQEGAA